MADNSKPSAEFYVRRRPEAGASKAAPHHATQHLVLECSFSFPPPAGLPNLQLCHSDTGSEDTAGVIFLSWYRLKRSFVSKRQHLQSAVIF